MSKKTICLQHVDFQFNMLQKKVRIKCYLDFQVCRTKTTQYPKEPKPEWVSLFARNNNAGLILVLALLEKLHPMNNERSTWAALAEIKLFFILLKFSENY